jgi:hypothetical protein
VYSPPPSAGASSLGTGPGWLALGLSALIVGAGAAALRPLMLLLLPVLRRSIFHMLQDHTDLIFRPALLAAFILGLGVGLAQSSACRWLAEEPVVWTVTTVLGWGAGVAVLLLAFADPELARVYELGSSNVFVRIPPLIAGLLAGLVAGGLQWLLVRRQLRRAWLWVVASGATYALAWGLAFVSRSAF